MKVLFWWIIFALSFLTFNASGQEIKSKKLDISIGVGLSVPIASYAKKDPSKSAIYIIDAPLPSVKGFDKGESGFAKTGFDYNFEIKYKLSNSLRFLLRTGTYSNSVETQGMSEFLTHLFGDREIRVEEGDYSFLYITPGIGYNYSLKKFDFGLDLLMGYSRTNYPYYKFVLLFTTVNPPIIFAHDGPQPDLGAFTVCTSLSATYKIFNQLRVGMILSFQNVNFSYNVSPRSIPGGSTSFDYSDILKVRVLNTGIKIGYGF
jgi:hypothetical protein